MTDRIDPRALRAAIHEAKRYPNDYRNLDRVQGEAERVLAALEQARGALEDANRGLKRGMSLTEGPDQHMIRVCWMSVSNALASIDALEGK